MESPSEGGTSCQLVLRPGSTGPGVGVKGKRRRRGRQAAAGASMVTGSASRPIAVRGCGGSWDVISPDLTRERPEAPAGSVFENPGRRGVIYTVAPSYKDVNTIWVGTDDGSIHVTKDGGNTWTEVTPPGLTAWSKVSIIDAGRHGRGAAPSGESLGRAAGELGPLLRVLQGADMTPTTQVVAAVTAARKTLDELLKRWREIKDKDVKAVNEQLKKADIPTLTVH
jgi:hypothetical protein